jgi:hypothetical protein
MDTPGLDDWQPWSPDEVFSRFSPLTAPWYFVGGWAIDLWLGAQTRPHEDIEICVLREDLHLFQAALPECEFFAAGSGVVEPLGEQGLPKDIHQMWCLDKAIRCWRLDVMIEPGTVTSWRYKRDINFSWPRSDMIKMTREGLPFLKPEAVLLFKAKQVRAKDDMDFERCFDQLDDKVWLMNALERYHSEHHWLKRLIRQK